MMASQESRPQRPRLSLQIKPSPSPATKSSRSYPIIDPKDPTALNTLSNVYMTAIERATPKQQQAEPLTAINTFAAFSLATPVEYKDAKLRVVTPHLTTSYPETPITATSPYQKEVHFPSTMTSTPPLSAGPVDGNSSRVFSFSSSDIRGRSAQFSSPPKLQLDTRQNGPRTPRTLPRLGIQLPYTHPRALHSILRNSPLPPSSAAPQSPRRQSRRLLEKASKKVNYDNPLTREIVNNKYTRSHIDLLIEESSPHPSPSVQSKPELVLDVEMAFMPNEIQDGGQTPGPFEDMRRRMAGSSLNSSVSSPGGIRKKKRKEKKRQWVWTIGQEEDDDQEVGGAIAATRAEAARNKAVSASEEAKTPISIVTDLTYLETPTPSIESTDSGCESVDVEMSDSSSIMSDERDSTPYDMELSIKTPTAPRLSSIGFEVQPQQQRDTPIPPELVEIAVA